MPVDILDILKQRFAGEPPKTKTEPDLSELLASGARVEYDQPEAKGMLQQLGKWYTTPQESTISEAARALAATPETILSLGTGVLGMALGGYSGMIGGPEAVERTAEKFMYQPRSNIAAQAVEKAMWPFEKVRESADWWGQRVADASKSPELGAAVSVAIESAAIFAGPKLVKPATGIAVRGISNANLLRLRRKLGTARRTGDFSDPGLLKVAQDILAEARKDPAMMADIQRYMEARGEVPKPPGVPEAIEAPRPAETPLMRPASIMIDQIIAEELKVQGMRHGYVGQPPMKPGETIAAYDKRLGIRKQEPTVELKAAEQGVKYDSPKQVGERATHELFDPQTKEYFEADSPEVVERKLQVHRTSAMERAAKHKGKSLEGYALELDRWWKGEPADINNLKQNVMDFINEKPRTDFETAGDYMDFIDRGEELLGLINKGMRERNVPPVVGGGKPPSEGLVSAIRSADGKVYYGKKGDIHPTLNDRYEIGLSTGAEMGFAGPDGKFLTRAEALRTIAPETVEAFAARRPGFAEKGELEYTGMLEAEAALKEVDPSIKLNDGNISEPKVIKPEDRINYMKQINEQRSRLKREQIEAAIEEGEDITDLLPEEARATYRSYLEQWERAVESSEPRDIGEIYADIKKLLGDPESGAISFENLTHEQKMALQRVVADAKRMVGDLTEYLKSIGLDAKQIAFVRRQIDEIRKVEPETFQEPRQHWIDSRAIAQGDHIVKQRKPGRGRQAMPVYNSEARMIQNTPQLTKAISEKVSLENPIRTLERVDPEGTGLKEVYYDYRETEQMARREVREMRADVKQLRKGIGWRSRKRIGAYAVAQQERGAGILRRMRIKVPELTDAEMAVYEQLRARYEKLFERIQTMRQMIGKEPLEKVDNYFTFFRTFNVLDKAGIRTNPLLDKPHIITSRYASYGSTPFRFGIERVKHGAMPVELDPFFLYEVYAETALRHLHLSPWVAKMHELLLTLPDPQTGKLTWRLSEHNPYLHHFLRNWVDHIAGKPSPLQLTRRVDRALTTLNQNLAYSVLGANVRSALIQVSALKNTITEIGWRYAGEGVLAAIEDVMSGGKNRQFALKHSKVLDGRAFDITIEDAMRMVRGGRIGGAYRTLGRYALKPLQWLDMETAIATWNGAFKLASDNGYNMRRAINFADDVVTRTQASALPGDLAPIQRSVAGKAFTLFQTFVINDWGFLTRDVLGIGNPELSNTMALRKVMRLVAATTMFNILMEDVVGIQSPFPTPIRDLRRSIEQDDPTATTARKIAFGLLDPVPIIGSARYGKGPGGPIMELGTEAVKSIAGAPMAKPLPEIGGRVSGIPGTAQVSKMVRAAKRGETPYGIIVGRYTPEQRAARRRRNPLGGLKGLEGLRGF